MGQVLARRMHSDGLYHYGASTLPAPHLGPLFGITAIGDGTLPEFPPQPATEEQHEKWLKALREKGFKVTVVPIQEPA
jgi:hypothetical protein